MIYVLDAGALIAFLRNEAGVDVVEALFADLNNTCYVHAINLYEVYYDTVRWVDEPTAEAAIQALLSVGLMVRRDMGADCWRDAARLKAAHRLSVADTFCLALARRTGATVVTTDHHEMDALVPLGLCPIQFIRPLA